ncbi:hypothetical protein K501DRAFT_329133, partial [Backusella circina FSU 941]
METPLEYSSVEEEYQFIKVFHDDNSNDMPSCSNDNNKSTLLNEEQQDNSVYEHQTEEKETTTLYDDDDDDDDDDTSSTDKLLIESSKAEAQSKIITQEAHFSYKSLRAPADNHDNKSFQFIAQQGIFLFMVT